MVKVTEPRTIKVNGQTYKVEFVDGADALEATRRFYDEQGIAERLFVSKPRGAVLFVVDLLVNGQYGAATRL